MNIREVLKNPREFLFESGGGAKQLIIKNTFWLALAEFLNQGLKLVLVIFAARILGAQEYGVFTFALAFGGLFLFIADFGLNHIVTREFSRKEQGRDVFSSLILLKLFLAGLALSGLFLFSSFVAAAKNPEVIRVIWTLGLMIVIHSVGELFFAYFRARQQMEKEAAVRILEALAVSALGFWVLFSFPSAFNLALAYLFSAAFSVTVLAAFFHRRVFKLGLRLDPSLFKKFLFMSWPLAFTEIFALIYNQIDSVMMGAWGFITEVGWYNAAYKVALGSILPIVLLSKVFFTPLAASFESSREKFQKIWDYFLQAVFVIALPLTVGGIILAPKIVGFLYGQGFEPSVAALQILMLMTFLLYLNYSFNRLLIAANRQFIIFWISFGGALLNILLNFILIPEYSLYGAAAATVLTFIFIFILFIFAISRQVKIRILAPSVLRTLFASILAASLTALFILWGPAQNWHVLASATIGALIYGAIIFILCRPLTKVGS